MLVMFLNVGDAVIDANESDLEADEERRDGEGSLDEGESEAERD